MCMFHTSDVVPPTLPAAAYERSFRELTLILTSGVEFSFDDVWCRQIDCVDMGSPHTLMC